MRISSLDGLRGLAILSVLLLHHHLFNNGWMGVDLFFVLSGFLITQILRKGRDNHNYWKVFYIKRSTRILPPLVLTIVLAYLFTPKATILVALGYLLTLGGFLDLTKQWIVPLGPLWSLAVEEHFYLAWPFAVRFLTRAQLMLMATCLLVGVPLLRLAVSHPMPTADLSVIYFFTPFRIDEMAMGCLLAVLLETDRWVTVIRRFSGWGFLAGMCTYAGLWVHLKHIYFYPGGHTRLFDSMSYSLVGFSSACAIAYSLLHPESVASRLLSFKPLAFLGRISYGVYLYHLLILNLCLWMMRTTSERMAFIIDLPLTMLLSWLSFRYYEQPLIRWGRIRANSLRRARVEGLVATSDSIGRSSRETAHAVSDFA